MPNDCFGRASSLNSTRPSLELHLAEYYLLLGTEQDASNLSDTYRYFSELDEITKSYIIYYGPIII